MLQPLVRHHAKTQSIYRLYSRAQSAEIKKLSIWWNIKETVIQLYASSEFGLSLSFDSPVTLLSTPIENLLVCGGVLSATGNFTSSIKKSSILSCNRCYRLRPFMSALRVTELSWPQTKSITCCMLSYLQYCVTSLWYEFFSTFHH